MTEPLRELEVKACTDYKLIISAEIPDQGQEAIYVAKKGESYHIRVFDGQEEIIWGEAGNTNASFDKLLREQLDTAIQDPNNIAQEIKAALKKNICSQLGLIPVPVTLNCSGGISLGAYMAGVVYELVREARSKHPLIEIDIITGASAGAITGLIAAYYLLEDYIPDDDNNVKSQSDQHTSSLNDATANEFYEIWVNKSNIDTFRKGTDLGPSEKKTCWGWYEQSAPKNEDVDQGAKERVYRSILTNSPVKGHAADNLQAENLRIGKSNTKSRLSHPLALIMTVTNLSGVLRKSGLKDKKAISYGETRQFLFSSTTKELSGIWAKTFVSAQASSAFPGAFLPVVDDSDRKSHNFYDCSDEYDQQFKKHQDSKICTIEGTREDGTPKEKFNFAYTDGGVLDNIPIIHGIKLVKHLVKQSYPEGATKKLCDDIDNFRQEWNRSSARNDQSKTREGHRKYIYVQPSPYRSLDDSDDLQETFFSWLTTFWKGLTIPHLEHDHLRLEDIASINDTYKAFEGLKTGCNDDKINKANPYVKVNLERIDPSLVLEKDFLTKNSKTKNDEPVINAIRQNLDEKSSCNDMLASDILGGFGGFFKIEYRKHDFLVGRLSALRWLDKICVKNPNCKQRIRIKEKVNQITYKNKNDFLQEDPKPTIKIWFRLARIVPSFVFLLVVEIFEQESSLIKRILLGFIATIALMIAPAFAVIVAIIYLVFSFISHVANFVKRCFRKLIWHSQQ